MGQGQYNRPAVTAMKNDEYCALRFDSIVRRIGRALSTAGVSHVGLGGKGL